MRKEMIVVTNSIQEVVDFHAMAGEPNWYKETYGGHYPVGRNIDFSTEWIWYYNGNKNDTHGQSGIWSTKNMVSRHPFVKIYTMRQIQDKNEFNTPIKP